MRSSRRYSLHLERSTSVGDIGSSLHPGLGIDDDHVLTTPKKFRPQPAIVKPSQTMKRESKDSKPDERSNTGRPSEDPSETSQYSGKLLKQGTPAVAGLICHVSAANSVSKDEEQHSTQPRPRPRVIEGIFFMGSPERELSAAKKEFKTCTLCKKEFKPDNDIYMYDDRPFCSSDCRDDQIALDGFNRKDFGLGKKDQKTIKSLRKELNQLHMYM